MDVVEQVKKRVRRAAQAIENELLVSHGINVSVGVSETAKSITVKIKVDATDEASPEEDVTDDGTETD